jgi:hypothetical protein
MDKPTQQEIEIGHSACKLCTSGILLHQAGYDVDTHYCEHCKRHVADTNEFFNVPVEAFSK